MRRLAILGLLVASSTHAEPVDGARVLADERSRHLIYVELAGKAGLYGIGYERALTERLSLGVAASYVVLRDQHIATATPYVHATLLGGRRHALFTELGASLVHSRIPSPVDDWEGMSESGGGGYVSLGWERAWRHLVLRTSGSIVVGEGGVAPWIGFAVGVRP